MTTTRYLWNPINQNIIREYDGAGNTVASYTTEPDLYGDVVSQHRDGQDSFYHTDGQGSTLALTDSNGDVTDTYAYSAFGEVTKHTGSKVNPFQYIGQKQYYRDQETGEYEVRRRSLIPLVSRWASMDPFLRKFSLDLYHYAWQNPINYVDPSGLICFAPAAGFTDEERCVLKDFKYPSKFGKCGISVGEKTGSKTLSIQFSFEAAFGEPSCHCCQFRQYVAGNQCQYQDTLINNRNGPWTDCPGLLADDIDEAEDINPAGFAYGHREVGSNIPNDSYLPSRAAGCNYQGLDYPGIRVDEDVVAMNKLGLIKKRTIDFKYWLLGKVVDICQDPPVVKATRFIRLHCRASLLATGVLSPPTIDDVGGNDQIFYKPDNRPWPR